MLWTMPSTTSDGDKAPPPSPQLYPFLLKLPLYRLKHPPSSCSPVQYSQALPGHLWSYRPLAHFPRHFHAEETQFTHSSWKQKPSSSFFKHHQALQHSSKCRQKTRAAHSIAGHQAHHGFMQWFYLLLCCRSCHWTNYFTTPGWFLLMLTHIIWCLPLACFT